MSNEAVDQAIEIECEIALAATTGASAIIPAGFAIAKVMGYGVGGPGTMIDGAAAWLDAGQDLTNARDQLTSLVGGLGSDQWSGNAHDAFVQKMDQFGEQLGDSAAFDQIVGAILGGLSAPLLAYGPYCDGIAAFMVAEAAFVVSASAATLGVGAGPAEAEAEAAAGVCLATTEAYNAALVGVFAGAAAGIEIDSGIEVKMQEDDGSTTIRDDWKKGQIDGAGEAALNAFNFAAGLALDKAGEKGADGLLGEGSNLATQAEKNLLRSEKEQLTHVFAKTGEKILDKGEEIVKDLAEGGDSGGSDGGGSAGGGGGGGGGGSWGDDPPPFPPGWNPGWPGNSGGGGGGGGGGSWPDDNPSFPPDDNPSFPPNQNPGWPGNNPGLPGGGGGGGSWGGDDDNSDNGVPGGGWAGGINRGPDGGLVGGGIDSGLVGGGIDSGIAGGVVDGGAGDGGIDNGVHEGVFPVDESGAERTTDSDEINGR